MASASDVLGTKMKDTAGGYGAASADAPAAPKKESFSAAFARNRKAGEKEFTWNGKRYNTKLKEDARSEARPTQGEVENTEGMTMMKRGGRVMPWMKKGASEDMACGGSVKKYSAGGAVRADGCAQRGRTKGKMC